jgi:hypothetical protein
MSTRTRLTNRRSAMTFDIELNGLSYRVTVGHFVDSSPAEAFISNHKPGNAADVAARDCGILISLLLQHGCSVNTIAAALSRNSDGSPGGIAAAAIDEIIKLGANESRS